MEKEVNGFLMFAVPLLSIVLFDTPSKRRQQEDAESAKRSLSVTGEAPGTKKERLPSANHQPVTLYLSRLPNQTLHHITDSLRELNFKLGV